MPNVLRRERKEPFMEGRIINVRKLVALDITLHSPHFIMAEFGIGTPIILAVGIVLMSSGPLILGVYLVLTGVNYVPLLIYAIKAVKGGTAKAEVAEDMSHDRHYVRKYSTQQLLLLIPLVVFWLAIWQEIRDTRP